MEFFFGWLGESIVYLYNVFSFLEIFEIKLLVILYLIMINISICVVDLILFILVLFY